MSEFIYRTDDGNTVGSRFHPLAAPESWDCIAVVERESDIRANSRIVDSRTVWDVCVRGIRFVTLSVMPTCMTIEENAAWGGKAFTYRNPDFEYHTLGIPNAVFAVRDFLSKKIGYAELKKL